MRLSPETFNVGADGVKKPVHGAGPCQTLFFYHASWNNLLTSSQNKTGWMDAESFGAEECVSCDTPDGYWRGLPLCSSSGEELCISCCSCNMCRSKWNILEVGEQKAESFNSYKVAPDLSSYTKAELVSSIAGPQGTAAYDEVVYDPLAQSRLSAESIDSFSLARLIVLGASIGVALGLYNTRRD